MQKKEEGEEVSYFYNTTKEGRPKSYITITDRDVEFFKHLRKEQMKEREKFEKRNKDKKYHDLGLVFCQSNGLPMWGDSIGKALKDFIQSNNLKPITMHGFRHTHCTLLILAGFDEAYVAMRVGHQSPITTRKNYLHVSRNNAPDLGAGFERILQENKVFTEEEIADASRKTEKILNRPQIKHWSNWTVNGQLAGGGH